MANGIPTINAGSSSIKFSLYEIDHNQPEQLARILGVLETIQQSFNSTQTGGKKVSMADLIMLGGSAAVEAAAKAAGQAIEVPFTLGRTDATQEQTHVKSFAVMEPEADGFRNYQKKAYIVSADTIIPVDEFHITSRMPMVAAASRTAWLVEP